MEVLSNVNHENTPFNITQHSLGSQDFGYASRPEPQTTDARKADVPHARPVVFVHNTQLCQILSTCTEYIAA